MEAEEAKRFGMERARLQFSGARKVCVAHVAHRLRDRGDDAGRQRDIGFADDGASSGRAPYSMLCDDDGVITRKDVLRSER